MKRVVGALLIGLGAFVLVTGILSLTWASSAVKRAPLDTDSVTRLSGTATVGDYTGPVSATSITLADAAKSDGDIVVYNSSSCLVMDPDGTAPDCVAADDPSNSLISAGTETFATDRRTAMGISDADSLPASATPKSGLVNKWPFDAEKKDYPYWDSVTGSEVTATYEDEGEIDGLEVYDYTVEVERAPIEITAGVDGYYSSEKTISIDPRTGSIIRQTEVQERVTTDDQPVLDLDFAFTDETVQANVDSAKDSISSLDLLSRTVPFIAIPVGLVLTAIGVLVYLAGRRSARANQTGARKA